MKQQPIEHVYVLRFRTNGHVDDLPTHIACRISTIDKVNKYTPVVCTSLGEMLDQLSALQDGRTMQELQVRLMKWPEMTPLFPPIPCNASIAPTGA